MECSLAMRTSFQGTHSIGGKIFIILLFIFVVITPPAFLDGTGVESCPG